MVVVHEDSFRPLTRTLYINWMVNPNPKPLIGRNGNGRNGKPSIQMHIAEITRRVYMAAELATYRLRVQWTSNLI